MNIFHFILLYLLLGSFTVLAGSLKNKMSVDDLSAVILVILMWPYFFLDLIFNFIKE